MWKKKLFYTNFLGGGGGGFTVSCVSSSHEWDLKFSQQEMLSLSPGMWWHQAVTDKRPQLN